jgi:hypothetical protein
MIIKVPFPFWTREHAGGITMGVMQLFDDAYDVVRHQGVSATTIEDGRRDSLEAACQRADAYLAEQGHVCGADCGEWQRKV